MRFRRAVALTGTGLILLGCFVLYFVMDQAMMHHMSKQDVTDNKWLYVNDRLKQLEDDLNHHHAEVGEMRLVIKHLSSPMSKPRDPNEVVEHKQPQQCSLRIDTAPHTNIQMFEMYESMKFDNPDGGVWKQGFKIEYDVHHWNPKHKLKVFVVPHSHNDPGWVKTVDEYFTSQTKNILNNMLRQLTDDPTKRFIWAEISYLSMWWDELSADDRKALQKIVRSGQLEIVTGGWVMPDEANSHWLNILLQLTEGHVWLRTHLNVTPTSSWSIDPFGQSSTMPLLLKGAGFDNLLIQRVHYAVKKQLALKRNLEFRWRQTWDGVGSTDLFTHMMPFYSYDVPHTCGPDPKICCQFDFKRLPGYGVTCPWKVPPRPITDTNVAHKAELVLDQWRKKSMLYRSRTVLIPLGDDFRYDQYTEWDAQMSNYQKLFDYMNNQPTLHVEARFGTLSDYFNSVRSEVQVNTFPTLSGDFFTYADRDDHYWSGYYTSRPMYKRMDRVLMNHIRSAEILHSMCYLSSLAICDEMVAPLAQARRALSLFQHHDAVAGTARDYVMEDYGNKMTKSIKNTKHIIQQSAYSLLSFPTNLPDSEFTYFEFDIDDTRLVSFSDNMLNRPTLTLGHGVPTRIVVLHNSLVLERNNVVSFHVSTPYVKVFDGDNNTVFCQVSPVWLWSGGLPQPSSARYELSFRATVPPMSLSVYTVQATDGLHEYLTHSSVLLLEESGQRVSKIDGFPNTLTVEVPRPFTVQSGGSPQGGTNVAFSARGLLKAISLNGNMVPVHLDFARYGVRKTTETSGAYLFLPDGPAQPIAPLPSDIQSVLVTEGPIESRVTVKLPYVLHETILRDGTIEIRNFVDISDTSNFELIMRVSTKINSSSEFFTDLNALQMIRRKYFAKLPLQANYYPISSAIYIEDSNVRLTVVSAQPLGGTSLKPGQIEIMQDRRLNQDDNRGLGQGVLDNKPTLHIFKLQLEQRKAGCSDSDYRNHPAGFLTPKSHTELQTMLHPIDKMIYTQDRWINMKYFFSLMKKSLPIDISIATIKSQHLEVQPRSLGVVFQRMQLDVCFVSDVDYDLGDTTVSLSSLFSSRRITRAIQTPITLINTNGTLIDADEPLQLCPMDIKGFLLEI